MSGRAAQGAADERAAETVRQRTAEGAQPGDRIGMLAGNRVEFVDAVFAAAKSGVVLVPLNLPQGNDVSASITTIDLDTQSPVSAPVTVYRDQWW